MKRSITTSVTISLTLAVVAIAATSATAVETNPATATTSTAQPTTRTESAAWWSAASSLGMPTSDRIVGLLYVHTGQHYRAYRFSTGEFAGQQTLIEDGHPLGVLVVEDIAARVRAVANDTNARTALQDTIQKSTGHSITWVINIRTAAGPKALVMSAASTVTADQGPDALAAAAQLMQLGDQFSDLVVVD
ncbi:hypothetical protein [Leifsonia xyli]|uniref:hypothetical protein n=1 Tax=Leifsonia xyli TaxID=1575 RepID=UPI003D66EA7E